MSDDPNRPQPVLNASKLGGLAQAAVVMVLGAVVVIQQGISAQNISAIGAAIAGAVTAVAALVTYLISVFHGRAAAEVVTPLSAPQNDAGTPLVPDPLAWRTDDHLNDHSPSMGPQSDQEPPNMQESYPPAPTNRPRLGRLPNRGRPRVKLTADLAPAGFTPPPSVDWYSKVPPQTWGMDGNDRVGDCTCAEVDHAVKTLQVDAGNPEVQSTDAEVLNLYSAVTGCNPADPNTDQGAEMQAVRNYWRKNGARLGGTMHTIVLFAEVDHRNHDLVKWCIARFGELGVGFNFPASAMDRFNAGQPWDVVPGSPIEGGHAVAAVGYDAQYVYVVTWGRVQPMTWAFWDAYVEEAWTQLSTEFVSGVSGNDPLGETLYQLGQQYQAVTGQPNPFPAPPPNPQPDPGPAPAPPPAPTPGPSGFPLAVWESFVKHPYSRLKEQAAIQAVNAWLNGH